MVRWRRAFDWRQGLRRAKDNSYGFLQSIAFAKLWIISENFEEKRLYTRLTTIDAP